MPPASTSSYGSNGERAHRLRHGGREHRRNHGPSRLCWRRQRNTGIRRQRRRCRTARQRPSTQVQLNARATDGGRFNIAHHTPDGIFAHLAGHVDWVAVTGSTAVVTGTITEGFDDIGIDPIGARVSLVIHDQEVDSLEMNVSFVSGHTIPPCSAEPILTVGIADGQFKVRT